MQSQESIFEKYGKCTLPASGIYVWTFSTCNFIFAPPIIYCKKQQKHSGQQCSWSINLLSGDFVDSTRGDAIATSKAVKTRSLCAAHKSQFSLVPGNKMISCTCHILTLCCKEKKFMCSGLNKLFSFPLPCK